MHGIHPKCISRTYRVIYGVSITFNIITEVNKMSCIFILYVSLLLFINKLSCGLKCWISLIFFSFLEITICLSVCSTQYWPIPPIRPKIGRFLLVPKFVLILLRQVFVFYLIYSFTINNIFRLIQIIPTIRKMEYQFIITNNIII